jgi:hypothetical protein
VNIFQRFLRFLSPPKRLPHIRRKKIFLSSKIKARADRKYNMLISKFKRRHKRNPTRNEKFRIIVAASHHTFPVKGRNVRRWTKAKRQT